MTADQALCKLDKLAVELLSSYRAAACHAWQTAAATEALEHAA